jgi:outer membrane lipoprotein-sorting protein
MPRLALLALLALAGCPAGKVVRPYPEPAAPAILEHLAGLRERATSLNAETKTDVRLGKERVNVTVMMLAAWGGKLRFQALDPNSAMAADLASDGERYCFIDVHGGCAECGAATPESVARLVRIPLEPDQVVAVLLGSTPVVAGDATVEWDASAGHEIVTVRGAGATQRIALDGRERRWDVLESELVEGGKTRWKIRHKDFHAVKTPSGETVRVPGASLFEEGGDTVRIEWRDQRVGEPLGDEKFRLEPQAGLPACPR